MTDLASTRQARSVNGTLAYPTCPIASGTTHAGRYLVREADPADCDLIGEFVSGLSVQSQYFRFFTAVAPGPALLRLLSDTSRADLLVVTSDRGVIVGHGKAVDAPSRAVASADVAVVIADAWQGRGLGTMVLDLMVARSARRGVTVLEFEVLPDNARMLGIIDRRFPGASRTRTADSISIRADITTWRQPRGGEQHVAPPSSTAPSVASASVARVRGVCASGHQGAVHESRPHAA